MAHQFPNQRFAGNHCVQNYSGNNQSCQNENLGVNYDMNPRQGFGTYQNQNYGNKQFSRYVPDSHPGDDQKGFNMQMIPQGQVNPSQLLHGPGVSNSASQGPIVQHVMIPVPVPVGSNISPHLLRPQIISTSGGSFGNLNPGQVMSPQNHFQGQGFYSSQNCQQNQFKSQRTMPQHSSFSSRAGKSSDDLSYYIGKDQRDNRRSRSSSEDVWQRSRSPSDNNTNRWKYEEKDREYKSQAKDRMHSSQDSFKETYEGGHNSHNDRYNNESFSDTDWKPDKRYENRIEVSYATDKSRYSHHSKKSCDYETDYNRHSRYNSAWHEQDSTYEQFENTDKYSRHDEYRSTKDNGRPDSRKNINDRNSEFQRSFEIEDYGKTEIQNFDRQDDFRTARYEPDRYERLERRSEQIEYRLSQADDDRHDYVSEGSRSKRNIEYNDNIGDLRNVQLNVRSESDSNYYDNRSRHSDHQSDRYDIDDFEDRKRKNSSGSNERYGKVSKREYSPVSDKSKPHDDIKIHVSERGRWIESYSNEADLTKNSAGSESNCPITYDSSVNQGDFLDGTEMVSDTDSIIGEEFDKVRQQSENMSPGLLEQSEHELNCGRELELGRSQKSSTHSPHSRHSDEKLQSRAQSFHENTSFDGSDKSRNTNRTGQSFEKIPHCRKLYVNGYPLKVPDLCPSHNQKGCFQSKCCLLHICKHFILKHCKFGDVCTKSHDLLKGQPFWVLKTVNPGFESSNILVKDIEEVLRERIFIPLEHKIKTGCSEMQAINQKTVSKPTIMEEKTEDVFVFDPSFDARNYAAGGFIASINAEVKKKVVTLKSEKNVKKRKVEADSGLNKIRIKDDKSKAKKPKEQNSKKRSVKSTESKSMDLGQQVLSSKKHNNRRELEMSPISGDEDDWEKYVKYETVSDDNLSDKHANELDNVSSDESVEEIIHSRAIDSFPAPTPENIAVPIGMNDPLVFNRPLKNNPSSYVGPMNRPPPMFPIANNAPLFPIPNPIAHVQPQPVGFHGAVPSVLPNHLPSPELLSQVIQHLPKFTVPPPESTKTFKNDTNPVTVVSGPTKKSKSEKNVKDPEMKETIKKLWTFPHKSVINMSVIEFVTETEAYKDELIAEIVKMLVTLELPYVTIKKLLAVIKEKIQVCIRSETDLRKILDMYPENFKVIENVDSDDGSDSSDTKRVFQIKANIRVGFCEKHGFLPFAIGKCDCRALHICKFYFLNDCKNKHCKFGHKLKTEHNINVLKQHKLHRLTGEELFTFMADVDSRNKDTIPKICKYYIREKGCYKGDNTDFDSICHSLHLCSYVIKGKCMNRDCERSHSIFDKQPLSLLQKYGLDPHELGAEKILQMLSERALLSTKDSVPSNPIKFYEKKLSMSSRQKEEASSQVIRTATKMVTAHCIKNYNNPSICKFYNNETGCRKKDWGPAGKCFFLHICQYYVNGDCKFGEKCKRSHDFYSGQAAEILEKFDFDLDNLSSQDILDRLNNIHRAPKVQTSIEDTYGSDLNHGQSERSGESDEAVKVEDLNKQAIEVETRVDPERNDGFTSDGKRQQAPKVHVSDSQRSANKNISAFGSCNVEDVIKHIINQNKIKQERKALDSCENVDSCAKN